MNRVFRFLLSLIFYCLTGVGISLTVRAGIGVSSFNSLNVALAEGLDMTVGWVTAAMNGVFLLGTILMDRPRRPAKYLLQAVAVLCLGRVIDFFTYGVFAGLDPAAYPARVMIFIAGTALGGASSGAVLGLGTLAFPIEAACQLVARRVGWPFRRARFAVDALFVAGSVALSISLGLPFFIREGTLISLILLAPSIGLAKRFCDRMLTRTAAAQA
jgi:uncharacterized membrane protein YczE